MTTNIKKLSTVLKSHAKKGFRCTAYIYRNGVELVFSKFDMKHGTYTENVSWLPKKISFYEKDVARVIIYNPYALLPFGAPESMDFFKDNTTTDEDDLSINVRTVWFYYKNGGAIQFDEHQYYSKSPMWRNSQVCVQGRDYWNNETVGSFLPSVYTEGKDIAGENMEIIRE